MMNIRRVLEGGSPRPRYGNAMVLAVALLVILAIVAVAYISRTSSGRTLAQAQQDVAAWNDRSDVIAEEIAEEISSALFPRLVVTGDLTDDDINNVGGGTVPSNFPRAPLLSSQRRYGIDTGTEPINETALSYNFAPYTVRPWTNWPDSLGNPNPGIPPGPGNPVDIATYVAAPPPFGEVLSDGNPLGNPGFGDTRWLRSTEPQRIFDDGIGAERFSHWPHLSNIARPGNGWRIAPDISNIISWDDGGNEWVTNLLLNMQVPVEQWLPGVIPPVIDENTSPSTWLQFRDDWFVNYGAQYISSTSLPNFIDLSSLGFPWEEFDTPPPNQTATIRNVVARTFTDTDGDGFTDSYWFLAPTSTDRAFRQVVGISIVDNAGMINANTATQFDRANTIGSTPADIALASRLDNNQVSQASDPSGQSHWVVNEGQDVGFLTNTENFSFPGNPTNPIYFEGVDTFWSPLRYGSAVSGSSLSGPDGHTFLQEFGVRLPFDGSSYPGWHPDFPNGLAPADARAYFNTWAGQSPFDPAQGLVPFNLGDELELRMSHGQNTGQIYTRFERAMNAKENFSTADQFLRSSFGRNEGSEFSLQLDNPRLLKDKRRQVTLFNATRNETMPPWLWPDWRLRDDGSWAPNGPLWLDPENDQGWAFETSLYNPFIDYYARNRDLLGLSELELPNPDGYDDDGDGVVDDLFNRREFERQCRKIDLRNSFNSGGNQPDLWIHPYPTLTDQQRRRLWQCDLTRVLEIALLWEDHEGGSDPISYFSSANNRSPVERREMTRSMIRSYVANIDQWRDGYFNGGASFNSPDEPMNLAEAIRDPNRGAKASHRYVGVEKHPFIMEAFVGIVYPKSKGPPHPDWDPTDLYEIPSFWQGEGNHFVDGEAEGHVVLAVQLGNPYDEPIPLGPFEIEAFGKRYRFSDWVVNDGANGVREVNQSTPGAVRLVLGPTTPEEPRSVIVYSIIESIPTYGGKHQEDPGFRERFIDFLDIEPSELSWNTSGENGDVFEDNSALTSLPQTLVINANANKADPVNGEETSRWPYRVQGWPFENSSVESFPSDERDTIRLIWNIQEDPQDSAGGVVTKMVVDRLDTPADNSLDEDQGSQGVFGDESFAHLLGEIRELGPTGNEGLYSPPAQGFDLQAIPKEIYGIYIEDDDYYMTWVHASRPWIWDTDLDGQITPDEKAPRFIFSRHTEPNFPRSQGLNDGRYELDAQVAGVGTTQRYGTTFSTGSDPDQSPWIRPEYARKIPGTSGIRRKITHFPCQAVFSGSSADYPGYVYPNDLGSFSLVVQGYNGGSDAGRDFFYPHALQMLQKDNDPEQVGEIQNIWLWGPVIEVAGSGPSTTYQSTVHTFSEMIGQVANDFSTGRDNPELAEQPDPLEPFDPFDSDDEYLLGSKDEYVNRLQLADSNRPAMPGRGLFGPALPPGAVLFDAFTCNDWGIGPVTDTDLDGVVDDELYGRYFNNGIAYTSSSTPLHALDGRAEPVRGLINVNTATREVLQALPFMTHLVHDDTVGYGYPEIDNQVPFPNENPRVRVADSIIRYRDKAYYDSNYDFLGKPVYRHRGYSQVDLGNSFFRVPLPPNQSVPFDNELETLPNFHGGMRPEQGIRSIGELRLLNEQGRFESGVSEWQDEKSFSIEFAGLDPYRRSQVNNRYHPYWLNNTLPGDSTEFVPETAFGYRNNSVPHPSNGALMKLDARLSTDRIDQNPLLNETSFTGHAARPDRVAGDVEEKNLLFNGISNLVTTRSDMFTVYFRVRTFRQNPVNGRWDATNPDYILDDSRYVMLVDRSGVQSPDDKPEILYLEKLPN